MSYIITFRGKPACPCLAEWLPVYERELIRRDVIGHNLDIYQLVGGAAASGGTHATGGAYDIAQVSDEAIRVAREMGAAAWHRRLDWDGHGGMEHHHGVLNGCPHNAPARYQIAAYLAGYNGLGKNGRGARDDGPRVIPLRNWQEGIAWATLQTRLADIEKGIALARIAQAKAIPGSKQAKAIHEIIVIAKPAAKTGNRAVVKKAIAQARAAQALAPKGSPLAIAIHNVIPPLKEAAK